VVIEPDDDAYHVFVPAREGCHSYRVSVDEARAYFAEAMALHIECLQQDGELIRVEREPLFITRLSAPVAA
jgi:predicted RNase H-like HicB family nuclease